MSLLAFIESHGHEEHYQVALFNGTGRKGFAVKSRKPIIAKTRVDS
jgi:hypothetical protein